MTHVNYEFKGRLRNEAHVRKVLRKLRARLVGTDHQVDTYLKVSAGRLKVREGRIENALIFYERANVRRPRAARIAMMPLAKRSAMRAILARALGVRAVVRKQREIYFVGKVKVHVDRVRGLGKFVEVEAISRGSDLRRIRRQAQEFQKLFEIRASDLVPQSYSDLILRRSRR